MSRGLGELQIRALRVLLEQEGGGFGFGDDTGRWLSLRVVKLRAWGTEENYHHRIILRSIRGTAQQLARAQANAKAFYQGSLPSLDGDSSSWTKGMKCNLHGPFKRALEVLVQRGYVRARSELEPGQHEKRKRLDRYYQITERGKCELLKVHTYTLDRR